MSEVKVNKITPRTNCGTTTLGDSGDTINIPAGVTISNNGTATGFGATGAVNWDTASIKTVDFTATAGVGYFVDTATTGAVEVTLPASPTAGDVIGVSDYAANFSLANCTLNRNGSNVAGSAISPVLKSNGVAVTLVYVDGTKGWIVTDAGYQSDAPTSKFVSATGGCITTCGNYKVHTFLAPGTFTVSCAGNCAGSNSVSYVVVAGGGGGGGDQTNGYGGGGGAAGGYREGRTPQCSSWTVSPLGCTTGPNNGLPVSASPGSYPITVGGGGALGASPGSSGSGLFGTSGVDSTFSTITSAGGGGGAGPPNSPAGAGGAGIGQDGGSGGGPSAGKTGAGDRGNGNTPPTTPPQGKDGGLASAPGSTCGYYGGMGGGGAGTTGVDSSPGSVLSTNGNGGDGVATNIRFTPETYSGGGGGGTFQPASPVPYASGCGGTGNHPGGNGAKRGGTSPRAATAGTINTGGGGGGASSSPPGVTCGSAGGSGIVIIRYRYQ